MEVVEFFPSQLVAEDMLACVLRDTPELEGELGVEAVNFDVASAPQESPAWLKVSAPDHDKPCTGY
jgi:hypothetical protein